MEIPHSEALVLLVYECPFCSASYTFSPEEVRVTKQVLCYCKKILKLKQHIKVDVNVTYGVAPTKPEKTPTYNAEPKLIEEAVGGLVSLGFKKKVARETVEHLIAKQVYNSVEKLISDACQCQQTR